VTVNVPEPELGSIVEHRNALSTFDFSGAPEENNSSSSRNSDLFEFRGPTPQQVGPGEFSSAFTVPELNRRSLAAPSSNLREFLRALGKHEKIILLFKNLVVQFYLPLHFCLILRCAIPLFGTKSQPS